jgi:biopolymer transport protein ExbD
MAFGSFSDKRGAPPMAEINVIPLVDIMLVLLVIFIITAPLLTHAVKIDLPQATSAATATQADVVQLSIDAAGQFYWDGERLDREALLQRFGVAAQQTPTPELHLHADRDTRYEVIAEVMSEAGKLGLARIAFVTDPTRAEPASGSER